MMQRRMSIRSARAASAAAGLMILTLPVRSQSPSSGDPPEARNMRLVGYNDLHGRSAYQPTIHHQGSRYIAYVGHHGGTPEVPRPVNRLTGQAENNGTSIVDVTDPAQPKYLAHIPGLQGHYEEGGAQMVRVCDGKTLPKSDASTTYMLRVFGGRAHEIWDVTDPAKPALLTKIVEGLKDTHKSWWECDTGIAYLVSGVEGWRVKRMTQVFDLSDPLKPIHIRDFGLIGQEPGSTGAVPTDLHGPISTGPQGNRVYFGYGTNKGGVLQIVDRDKLLNGPKEPTAENLRYPVVGQLDMLPFNGAHTVVPMLKMPIAEFAKDKDGKVRDFVMIVNEQILNECQEARQIVFFVDVTIESRPMVVSNFSVPEASGTSASAEGASARIPRTRAWRQCFIRRSSLSPTSMPACARSTCAIRISRRRSATSSRRSRKRPISAASRSTGWIAARLRSRATMWKPTTAVISTWSIAPTPACTFWSSLEKRERSQGCGNGQHAGGRLWGRRRSSRVTSRRRAM